MTVEDDPDKRVEVANQAAQLERLTWQMEQSQKQLQEMNVRVSRVEAKYEVYALIQPAADAVRQACRRAAAALDKAPDTAAVWWDVLELLQEAQTVLDGALPEKFRGEPTEPR